MVNKDRLDTNKVSQFWNKAAINWKSGQLFAKNELSDKEREHIKQQVLNFNGGTTEPLDKSLKELTEAKFKKEKAEKLRLANNELIKKTKRLELEKQNDRDRLRAENDKFNNVVTIKK